MDKENKIIVFEHNKIRRVWYNDEWHFSVIDVIQILTNSNNPRNYWSMLKKREEDAGIELSTNCVQLKLKAPDGKLRETDCANTKSLFRIIQSIPSKKAEPFKKWLAKVGYERIQEIENPELGQDRIKEYYELKGYPKKWIDKRLRGIAIRQELTDEWRNRDIKNKKDFAILTNEISKATFGKTIGEYKEFKQLRNKNHNLRDHMTDLELIFTMLGEKTTTEITKERDSQGFEECKESAKEGGEAANDARESVERRLGKSTISKDNFLLKQKKKKEIK
ncbi:MAG: Bro-N domain-containing protein [Nanoarchaeota archaeon]|nr:Bro-N domain-containing protein [Nanoarchaeota archaeon]